MNTRLWKAAVLLVLCLMTRYSSAQVYSPFIVGYVNTIFGTGNTLFSNPLVNDLGPDTLGNLFNSVPDGTTVSLWNPSTSAYDTSSEYSGGVWSVDLTLEPGTGALLNSPAMFTNTFVGTVLNHDGSFLTGDQQLSPPPMFSGPSGTYLLGDKAPTVDTGTDIFLNILGRLPNIGEQVTVLNTVSQNDTTSTYLGDGNWDNIPVLGVGQAAFLKVEPAPEPGAFSIFTLGIIFIYWRMKRLNRSLNQPPLPLRLQSTPRVGGGSAFFVRLW